MNEDIELTPTATLDPGKPVWIIGWVSQNEGATVTVNGTPYAREENLSLMLGQTLIVRTADQPTAFTLNGDKLFLSAAGEIEIRDRERRLLAGRLVVQAIAQEQTWQNQLGSQAVIAQNGIAGLETDVNNPALFALHCFAGVCTLKGDLAEDVATLAAGQSSAVGGAGRPGEMELADRARFNSLAPDVISGSAVTMTPTNTPLIPILPTTPTPTDNRRFPTQTPTLIISPLPPASTPSPANTPAQTGVTPPKVSPTPTIATLSTVTPTSSPTPPPLTATFTPTPPTATFTPLPPTATFTPLPPTATFMPLPPTATFTPLPPTATFMPPPPTATIMPSP